MEYFVIDFEYLTGRNDEIVVKELSIMPVRDGIQKTWTFLPPYPVWNLSEAQVRSNRWITSHRHVLNWKDGSNDYRHLKNLINRELPEPEYTTIFVKGTVKSDFISDLIPNCELVELESIDCPRAEDIQADDVPKCYKHPSDSDPARLQCARINAYKFAYWCFKNLSRIESEIV